MGRRASVALTALALLASACGGSDSASAEAQQSETAEVAMAASSPIGAYLLDDGGFDAAMLNYIALVEEEILLCMTAQGFEFARTEREVTEMQRRMRELTLREWTAEYGFGISTSVESFDPTQSEDPNTRIIMQMTTTERELWVQTLTGGQPEVGAAGMDLRPLEDQGCVGQGFINTGGGNALEGFTEVGETYEERQVRLLDQPAVAEVVQAWSRCMSDAGFPGFGTLDEPEDHVEDRLSEIQQEVSTAGVALSEEDREAWLRGDETDVDPAFFDTGLFALQEDEIALAVADLDCYEAEVRQVHEPLLHAMETEMIGEFEEELSALKDLGQ